MRKRMTLIQTFRNQPAFYREKLLEINRRYSKSDNYQVVFATNKSIGNVLEGIRIN